MMKYIYTNKEGYVKMMSDSQIEYNSDILSEFYVDCTESDLENLSKNQIKQYKNSQFIFIEQ